MTEKVLNMEIKNTKLHEFSLMAGGSHYPSINPDMQEAFARMIIRACKDAVDTADLRDMVRTTWERDFSNSIRERIKQNIDQTFGAKND